MDECPAVPPGEKVEQRRERGSIIERGRLFGKNSVHSRWWYGAECIPNQKAVPKIWTCRTPLRFSDQVSRSWWTPPSIFY